jgi:hypothetical protein
VASGRRSDTDLHFGCECARPGCCEPVEILLGHYAFVRERPGRFILLGDHVTPQAERVVFTTNIYVVVENKSAADEVVKGNDPRA